jgi:pyridoxal 5'-phosphate synthase pdxT subunit
MPRAFHMRIGVLAVQGDYDAHRHVLERLGAHAFYLRKPEELDRAEGLVIPGGESSTFLNFLQRDGFFEKLKSFVHAKPTFGTCAGLILLANEVVSPEQPCLGALDVKVRRNAYGRQIDSSIRQGTLKDLPLEMVFIRAPKIKRIGPDVEVLAREGGDPVLVRERNVMAATFHPELTEDTRVHETFLELARAATMSANVRRWIIAGRARKPTARLPQ